MNSKNKMIRLIAGFILLGALLAFQGSSTGKGCFSCEDYTSVTFTNGTATKIALVLSGPMSSTSTIEPGGSYWNFPSGRNVQLGSPIPTMSKRGRGTNTPATPWPRGISVSRTPRRSTLRSNNGEGQQMKTKTWIFMVLTLLCLVVLLPAKPAAKIRVAVASANIRSGPAANAPVIGQGKHGEVFDVLGREEVAPDPPAPGQGYGSRRGLHPPERHRRDPDRGEPPPRGHRPGQARARENGTGAENGAAAGETARGFFVEGGLMISPKTDSFADKWLLGIGFDKGINPYISLGMEFQPHIRSVSEFKLTYISANLFVNVRGGINLGQLTPALKFWTPYVGFGPGTALSFTHVSNPGGSYNKFQANFAYHFTIGSEFALGSKGLFVEYQIVRVSQPNVDPDGSCSFLVAGLRF